MYSAVLDPAVGPDHRGPALTLKAGVTLGLREGSHKAPQATGLRGQG